MGSVADQARLPGDYRTKIGDDASADLPIGKVDRGQVRVSRTVANCSLQRGEVGRVDSAHDLKRAGDRPGGGRGARWLAASAAQERVDGAAIACLRVRTVPEHIEVTYQSADGLPIRVVDVVNCS